MSPDPNDVPFVQPDKAETVAERTEETGPVDTGVLLEEQAQTDQLIRDGRRFTENPDGSKSFNLTDGREFRIKDDSVQLVVPGTPPKSFKVGNFKVDGDTVSYTLGHLQFSESPDRKCVLNTRTNVLSVFDADGNLRSRTGGADDKIIAVERFRNLLERASAESEVKRTKPEPVRGAAAEPTGAAGEVTKPGGRVVDASKPGDRAAGGAAAAATKPGDRAAGAVAADATKSGERTAAGTPLDGVPGADGVGMRFAGRGGADAPRIPIATAEDILRGTGVKSVAANDLNLLPGIEDPHERIGIAVNHFFNGSQRERAAALRALQEEVKQGNLSALFPLQRLSINEAAIRLETARAKLETNSGDPDALKARREALRDLSCLELSESGALARQILDRAPSFGIPGGEVAKERVDAVSRRSERTSQADAALASILSGSPSDRRNAVAALRQLNEQEMDAQKSTRLAATLRMAEVVTAANELLAGLNNPAEAAAKLQEIQRLDQEGDRLAKRILSEIAKTPQGAALLSGNPSSLELADRLKKPDAVKAVSDGLKEPLLEIAARKGLKASDILKEQTPEQLEAARAEARRFSEENFDKADKALESFLQRNASPEQREAALKKLEEANAERLQKFGNGQYAGMLHTLQDVDALKKVHEAVSEWKNATPDKREAALNKIVEQLKGLESLALQDGHLTAFAALKKLAAPAERARLLERIANGDENAIKSLQQSLSDGKNDLDALRSMRVVRDLTPSSTPADFVRAVQKLKEEVKAGNESAQDWLKWAQAGQKTAELVDAVKKNDVDAAKLALEALGKDADSNPYAKSALAGILAREGGNIAIADWRTAETAVHDGKPPLEVDPGKWGREHGLVLEAARHLTAAVEKTGMSREDAHAISVALANAAQEKNVQLEKMLGDSLDRSISKGGDQAANAMEGLFKAIQADNSKTHSLADHYVKGLEHPAAARQFEDIRRWAASGDPNSIYILSAVVAGGADRNSDLNTPSRPIAGIARETLASLAYMPEARSTVQSALVDFYKKNGDRNQLLSTLGSIVSRIEDSKDVHSSSMELLRSGLRLDAKTDPVGRKSAIEGFNNAVRHWTEKDQKAIGDNMSADLAKGIAGIADQIPEPIRAGILEQMHGRLIAPKDTVSLDERVAAIQAIGALARYASKEQVESLSKLGGESGKKYLKESLGLTDEQVASVQETTAKSLLRIIAFAPNAEPDKIGSRETAFDAFKKHSWPGIKDELRDTLVDYARGRIWDAAVSREVSLIVYDAGLPRPTAGILHDWGVRGEDSADLLAKAEIVARNYDGKDPANPARNITGEELLRRISANIELVNSLSPELRKKLTGSEDQVLPSRVFGQMYNKVLQDSDNKVLMQDMPAMLDKLRSEAGAKTEKLTTELKDLEKQRSETIANLINHTKQGVYFWNRAAYLVGSSYIPEFERTQSDLVRKLPVLDAKIAMLKTPMSELATERETLRFAAEARQYSALRTEGKQREADQLMLSMWQEYGPMLAKLNPHAWNDLVKSDGTQVGRSALARMKDAGIAQFAEVPTYQQGPEGFAAALDTLKSIKPKEVNGAKFEFADAAAMRAHALGRLDSDPVFEKMQKSAGVFQKEFGELAKLFDAATSGTKYEGLTNRLKDRAAMIDRAMKQITPEDLTTLRRRIETMQDAVDKMKADPDSNSRAINELQSRIKTYKSMHDIFCADEKLRFDPKNGTNKMVTDIVGKIQDRTFREDTFVNWLKTNGPVIASTVLAVSATVAACATFGVASPLAVAAIASAAAIATSEITREILYATDGKLFGFEGLGTLGERSKLGSWLAKDAEYRTLGTFLLDVAGPYAGQVILDTGVAFVTMGIGKYFMEGLKGIGPAGLKALVMGEAEVLARGSVIAARAQALTVTEAGKKFLQEWGQQTAKQLLWNVPLAAAHHGAVNFSADACKAMGLKIDASNYALNTGVSIGLALLQNKVAAKLAGDGAVKIPHGADLEAITSSLRLQGLSVTKLPGGGLKVFDPAAPKSLPPYKIDVEPPVGTGKPLNVTDAPSTGSPYSGTPDGAPGSQPPATPARKRTE